MPEQSPCVSFRLDAAIMFESPEAASCRLTLTNTAQKLRLGGCKLFSSSQEKHSQTACRRGGVWAVTPCHIPCQQQLCRVPPAAIATLPASGGGGAGHGGPCIDVVLKGRWVQGRGGDTQGVWPRDGVPPAIGVGSRPPVEPRAVRAPGSKCARVCISSHAWGDA